MAGIKRCPADAAFSLAVRMSRRHTCEHCHRTGRCEAAHIYGRAQKVVRWDVMNILCLCHTCHQAFGANPLDFDNWVRRYLGQGHIDILNEKRRGIFKTTKESRKEIAKHYNRQIKLIEADPNHQLESFQ